MSKRKKKTLKKTSKPDLLQIDEYEMVVKRLPNLTGIVIEYHYAGTVDQDAPCGYATLENAQGVQFQQTIQRAITKNRQGQRVPFADLPC